MKPVRKRTQDIDLDTWHEMASFDVSRLLDELEGRSSSRVDNAITWLHVKGNADVVAFALNQLKSTSYRQRDVGVRVLSQLEVLSELDKRELVPVLSDILTTDSSATVRTDAAIALGYIGKNDAVVALGASITDRSPNVRRAIAFAASRIEGRLSNEILLKLSFDQDENVRMWAAMGLRFDNKKDNPFRVRLEAMTNDSSEKVADEACSSLQENGLTK